MAWLKRHFRFLTLIHNAISSRSHFENDTDNLQNNAGHGKTTNEIHYKWWGDDRYEPV